MPKKEHAIWMHPSQGLKRHLETLSKLSIEFPLAMYGRSFPCLGPSFPTTQQSVPSTSSSNNNA